MALLLRKWRLLFMDGTTETIESIGLFLAWFKGKLRAAEKRTVLLKVEEVQESTSFSPVGKFHVRYIDLETGRTVEKTISDVEQYDLYREQREGKISIIEIEPIEAVPC